MASSSLMPYVYVLRCADGSLYIGHTDNLETRLLKHNQGSASSFTAMRRPVAMVYSEQHHRIEAAVQRERQLKRWTRRKKEALIRGDWQLLKKLSTSR